MPVYKKYVAEYVDEFGNTRIKTIGTNKEEAREALIKIRKRVRQILDGTLDTVDEKLATSRKVALHKHLQEYEESLETTDCTKKHIRLTMSRIRTVINGCRFDSLSRLEAHPAQLFLSRFVKEKKLGPKTYNHYAQALAAFGYWLEELGRIKANPFKHIKRRKASLEIRHRRRALPPEEMSKLVMSAVTSGCTVQSYDGLQRGRAYLMSYLTGLRQSEVSHLTAKCFDLNVDNPRVRLAGKFAKNREDIDLPVHPQLVEIMNDWLPELSPGQALFPGFGKKKAWLMVRKDLERIGIPYENEDGIADYHAIGRCSYITQLLVSGVPIHVAMKLARHKSIEQTKIYAKVRKSDEATSLNKLPAAPVPSQWKSQWLNGNPCPKPTPTVPKKPTLRRSTKSLAVTASVPSRAQNSGGGDECRTPPEEWRRRESNPRPAIDPRKLLRV